MKIFIKTILWLISISATILIVPFISFWLAYFGGWICSLTFGNALCRGLNTLFNTNYFTKDMIPICAATLGWIGGYFKSRNVNTSNN